MSVYTKPCSSKDMVVESEKPKEAGFSTIILKKKSHYFMANRWGNNEKSERLFWGDSKVTADGDCSHEIKRGLLLGRKAMSNLDTIPKRHYFANKGLSSQSYSFSSNHVWI